MSGFSETTRAVALALALATAVAWAPRGACAQPAPLKISAPMSLTGSGAFYGAPALDGAQLAAAEANAEFGEPKVEIVAQDDESSPQRGAELAGQISSSDAVAVVGPALTVIGMQTGPIYAQAGLASIVPTAHGDDVPAAATTFQPIFNTGRMGAALANYLFHILQGRRAAVIFREDAYGRPTAEGFQRAAQRLGLEARFLGFKTDAERQQAAATVAADPDNPPVALGILSADAVPLITALRRAGRETLILGPDSIAGDSFADLFAGEPEEHSKPGFFTKNLYAVSPIMFDSADDATLAFARRFRDRYGHDPAWPAVQGYDSARLAIAAVRYAAKTVSPAAALQVRRKAVLDYLASLNSPEHALAGVTGPLWFTASRGRDQPVRMGRFEVKLFESAPLQLMPVANPDRNEIESGQLRQIGPNRFARLQQVVYTGLYLNEVPRLDIAPSTFTADFYLWLRYTPADRRTGVGDPGDISFPDLVRGSFNPKQPVAERALDDGTIYRLWRMRGDFKNDFDLHRYPLDRQKLAIRLFNATAASDRIVYVLDRQSLQPSAETGSGAAPRVANLEHTGGAEASETQTPEASSFNRFDLDSAPDAFRNLTQWWLVAVQEHRDNLVTLSGLGDPVLVGLDRKRELSGFGLTIDVQRRLLATLVKSMLPLGIMTLIMFASLYFPHGLVKEKVAVAITAALSGAVLLSSVNTQLGTVGYTMAVEYVFYIFFGLCLFCILSVLAAERLRVAGQNALAIRTEFLSRGLFLITVIGVVIAAFVAALQWQY